MKTVFTNARVVDGRSEAPLIDATVVVEDGRIISVTRVPSRAENPALAHEFDGAKVYDLAGKTLMPGLIDLHIHLAISDDEEELMAPVRTPLELSLHAVKLMRQAIMGGVTTVRDVGADEGVSVQLSKAVELGWFEGPRVVPCGLIICTSGGHGSAIAHTADGPGSVRQAVRQQLGSGARCIKLTTTSARWVSEYTIEELSAGVDEAHRRGFKVACHAGTEPGIGNAVRAGVDTIEHCWLPAAASVREMVERGTVVVPTITVRHRHRSLGWTWADQKQKTMQILAIHETPREAATERLHYVDRSFNEHHKGFRALLEAGVKIGAGTDAPINATPIDSVRNELVYYVRWGMSPMQALNTATSVAAEALGWQDEIGTVEPGKLADLIVVDGDPSQNIEDIDSVRLVMREGRIYRDELL